jgi:acetolactate synthase I/II/III large subunit
MTDELTGGQAVVRSLVAQGVDTVFGLPGIQLDWIFDALYEERSRIRVIHPRHEQAAAYMADGYARATGRPGVFLVVPGPGVLNALAGLSTAYACSSPVLCIAGEIPSDGIGKGRGLLHEIPDQLGALRAVVVEAELALSPQRAADLVAAAFGRLRGGRTRPVAIDIPTDVLEARGPVLIAPAAGEHRPQGDPAGLEAAARLLVAAERPLIFAGGGVLRSDASVELIELAEKLDAPVVTSVNARGAIPSSHRLAVALPAATVLMPDADVILVAGSRFLAPATAAWGPKPGQTVVQLDADAEEIGRNHPVDLAIVADARAGLGQLAELVGRTPPKPAWAAAAAAAQARLDAIQGAFQPQAGLAGAIRAALPEDGIFINGMTQVGHWSVNGFPVERPHTFIGYGYQGTLGYELGTALGAKVGCPDRKVVCVAGDGGFMYQVQELATAVQHEIAVAIVVFNDSAFGNVKRIQQTRFGGRTIASDLHNPDFVQLARAFGAEGLRAEGPEQLEAALRTALEARGPVLIDVPLAEVPNAMTPTLIAAMTAAETPG